MLQKSNLKRGQALVEFAFTIMLLVALVISIMDFSILLYDKAILTAASREGARAGVVFRTDPNTGAYNPVTQAEIQTIVNNYLQSKLFTFGGSSTATTTATPGSGLPPSQGGTGQQLDVLVTFQYTFLALPRFQGWNNTINLSALTTMRYE